MKKFFVFLAFLFSMLMGSAQAQSTASGVLSGATYADFTYVQNLSKPYSALTQGQTLKLQSRFVWMGSDIHAVTVPQHTITAFTQRVNTTGYTNAVGDILWSHGAGAIVGEFGMGLELWFRDDANHNGYDDDATNAYVWKQGNNGCAEDVLGTLPAGSMCLSSTNNGTNYITSAPNFILQTGTAYWVRMKIVKTSSTRALLYAELIEENNPSVILQSAATGFDIAKHFPLVGQPLTASIARIAAANYQPNIMYNTFDYGF